MPFEKFVPPRKQKLPQVSIKRTGTISFDKPFAVLFGLDKAGYVTLHFDASRKLVAVKPAEAKEEGAVKLSHRKRVSSVRARAFFEWAAIRLERTNRYPVAHDKEGGMVVIDLGEVRRRPGRRRRQR